MNTWLPPLIISYRAYAIGGMCWAINWTVFPSGSGFRVRRTIWNPFGRWSESGWETTEETHEGYLSAEAFAQAQAALQPIWQDPAALLTAVFLSPFLGVAPNQSWHPGRSRRAVIQAARSTGFAAV